MERIPGGETAQQAGGTVTRVDSEWHHSPGQAGGRRGALLPIAEPVRDPGISEGIFAALQHGETSERAELIFVGPEAEPHTHQIERICALV